jgi:hypothetical protein
MTRQASKRRRRKRKRQTLRSERAHCAHKAVYKREITAVNKAAELGLTYYRCPHCRRFHLTKVAA